MKGDGVKQYLRYTALCTLLVLPEADFVKRSGLTIICVSRFFARDSSFLGIFVAVGPRIFSCTVLMQDLHRGVEP
jgi:hypothetical protein